MNESMVIPKKIKRGIDVLRVYGPPLASSDGGYGAL